MRYVRSRRIGIVAAAALVAVALSATAAYSLIPSADGTIHACYEKTTGIIRVIDTESGRSCLRWEQPLSWDQHGSSGGLTQVISADIVDGEVKTPDIAPGAVTPDKLSATYLTEADVTSLRSAVTGNTSAISQLQSDVTALQGSFSTLTSSVSTNTSDIVALQQWKTSLSSSAVTPDIDFSHILIPQQSISGTMLKDGDVGNLDLGVAAVTSAKIADGAVTPDKQTAYAAEGTSTGVSGSSGSVSAASVAITVNGAHKVLLTGQVQIANAGTVGSGFDVTVQLRRDDSLTPIGLPWTIHVDSSSEFVPISFLDTTPSNGNHAYTYSITATGGSGATLQASLIAVDLGQ